MLKPCVVCGIEVESKQNWVEKKDDEIFCKEHQDIENVFKNLEILERQINEIKKSFDWKKHQIRKVLCKYEWANKPIESYDKKLTKASAKKLMDFDDFIDKKYEGRPSEEVFIKELEARFENPEISSRTCAILEDNNYHTILSLILKLGWAKYE